MAKKCKVDSRLRVYPECWDEPVSVTSWFEQPHPVEIDLGSGKGRFLLSRAASSPGVNFLGVERMLGRVRRVGIRAEKKGLANVRMLRVEGYYAVRYLIPSQSIQTYYIFFPDPWPKRRHHQNRILNTRFLDALYETLVPGGQVHFATDHLPYFYETVERIQADSRFVAVAPYQPCEEERTDFELLFLGDKPIGRYSFRRGEEPANGIGG